MIDFASALKVAKDFHDATCPWLERGLECRLYERSNYPISQHTSPTARENGEWFVFNDTFVTMGGPLKKSILVSKSTGKPEWRTTGYRPSGTVVPEWLPEFADLKRVILPE